MVFFSAAKAAPSKPYAEGKILSDMRTLTLKSSVAQWIPASNWLQIYLFPFELNEKELEDIKDRGVGFWLMEKDAYYATMNFFLNPGVKEFKIDNIIAFTPAMHGPENNFQINMSIKDEDVVINELSGLIEPGAMISLKSSGDVSLKHLHIYWDLKLESVVIE